MEPLRILISNDDGIFADGIRTLAAAASARGHRVTVVCPDQERSATGHGLTLHTPLRAERADALFAAGVEAWACSGTPADCVKLALFHLLEEPPQLVLSGINHGPNLGTDVFCSGTVAAAMEGILEGVPSMAVSSACFQWRQFEPAARVALEVAESTLAGGWPDQLLLNLNVPPLAAEAMKPLRWCRASVRRYEDQFSRRVDPRGRTYFWLAGEAIVDLESSGEGPEHWPSDVAQIVAGGPSLTPMQPELFWRGPLAALPPLAPDPVPSRPAGA
ncbi:5'/3'-nucleotidase SurE [Synechococcus sp. RSCCF101]|uniref:5'/3'-nucleotidase SurE n=1 Tax=Synechococcus sp. RSCCF101 TaxID=2511069 RepID=UPI00124945A8|nr:5'/3'-nucleotidase SurE [Synechococcus sp. RSCCF101]QEY33415.1 5'/3'-nucleotidase SurE [Synechococcus sp. RSCCF101]